VRVRCQRLHATLPTLRTEFDSPYPQSEHRPIVVRALRRPKPRVRRWKRRELASRAPC